MSRFAILGSTGNCGTALIDNLLRTPDAKVNAYCRNRNKLVQRIPEVQGNKRVQTFEGSIDDHNLLVDCLRGVAAIFHCVSTNDNAPGYHASLDTAKAIIRALEQIDREVPAGAHLPKVILLSSATIDDHLSRSMPRLIRSILLTAASHVYEDCRQAEVFLRSKQDLVTSIFMKPGGLSVDIQRGHKIDLDHEESFISYLDLAAAMIEAAQNPEGRYDMQNVSVVNTNGSARFPAGTPMCILANLLRHYFPSLHSYLPSTGHVLQ